MSIRGGAYIGRTGTLPLNQEQHEDVMISYANHSLHWRDSKGDVFTDRSLLCAPPTGRGLMRHRWASIRTTGMMSSAVGIRQGDSLNSFGQWVTVYWSGWPTGQICESGG